MDEPPEEVVREFEENLESEADELLADYLNAFAEEDVGAADATPGSHPPG